VPTRRLYFTGGVTPAPVVEPLSELVVTVFFFFSFLPFLAGSEVDSVFVVVVVTVFPVDAAPPDWSLHPTLSKGTTAIAAMLTRETILRKRLIGRAFPFAIEMSLNRATVDSI
jgi:hypothetical protein